MLRHQGFTIIEVVIVLGVAGLIFLMIFIALQRDQRDTARRNDVATLTAAVQAYKSNNKNSVTALTTQRMKGMVGSLSQLDKERIVVVSPETTTYGWGDASECFEATPNCTPLTESAIVVRGYACAQDKPPTSLWFTRATHQNVAVGTALENSGSSTGATGYCQDV